MKKWAILIVLLTIVVACNDEASKPSIEKLDEVNENVQAVIDMTSDDKFASVIYSEAATSYLLLNATGTVKVDVTPEGSKLNINIDHKVKDDVREVKDIAYAFYLDQPYDKIHVFENGVEIPFEVWTE